MRPSQLDPMFAPLAGLNGVGPKALKAFERLLGPQPRVIDLLFHLPTGVIDNRLSASILEAPIDKHVVIGARVAEHRTPARGSNKPLSVLVEDDTGDVLLVFFRNNFDWVLHALPIGEIRWFSGDLKIWNGYRQIAHPRIFDAQGFGAIKPFEPVYPLVEGLYGKNVQKAVEQALKRAPELPEWLESELIQAGRWPSFVEALRAVHGPQSQDDLSPQTPARARLAYDELLSQQTALRLVRNQMQRSKGRSSVGDGRFRARIEQSLPWPLTGAQTQALAEIAADMASDKPMLRLLQGDVGSGKTIVALLAMASAVEAGRQGALMAPTDILARQHFERLTPLAEDAGLRLGFLSGRDKASERRATLAGLASGEIDICIGTHALAQQAVTFKDLGLAVVDEQHRFGVHQRLALSQKGAGVDILVMTATPIPRTLALTYFGDMDASNLREKPPGRQKIVTRAASLERLDETLDGVSRALAKGAQIYWVCPLVSESEKSELAAAEERFEFLQSRFGERVGLVHGQMPAKTRDGAMEDFVAGRTKILVATTVIEVGVDVAQATIMIIEHAERFGLAQLHQLRGRVGRGAQASSCLLLYKAPLGAVSSARLKAMRESDDGFWLAEEDLKLRGEGEILGARQSGTPGFIFADLTAHRDLLDRARNEAERLVGANSQLSGSRADALRYLLYLFGRDEAAKIFRAG